MKPMAAVLVLAAALPSSAQPRLQNATVVERAVAGTLQATVTELLAQATDPAWIAWETTSVPRRNQGDDDWCWNDGHVVPSNRLEPRDTIFIFLRVEARRIDRVRMYDDGCPVDAGGRRVTWLTGVKPPESVTLLADLASNASSESRIAKGALAALAQHAGPAAAQPLIRLARQAPDARVRGDALFWLSQRAGREAEAAITDAIEHDPETQVKKRAVFALSQLPPDDGVPRLIEIARRHGNPAVRKQAMFWLGQSKDPRALSFFEEVLK